MRAFKGDQAYLNTTTASGGSCVLARELCIVIYMIRDFWLVNCVLWSIELVAVSVVKL
jgi:hypothetical protein